MNTLEEIKAAAETLSLEQKQQLFLYIAASLRANGTTPPLPRKFSDDQIAVWIAEDEADMRRFRESIPPLEN